MKAVLLSGSYRKIEIPAKIAEFINNNIKDYFNICFIASSFDIYNDTDKYVKKLLVAFEQENIVFDKVSIVDERMNKNEMVKTITESNIIFLLGGDTLKQIDSINKYELSKFISNSKKIIIGMSAGAINMADTVILAKDEEDNIPQLSIYKGIGITTINLEPHCDFKNNKHWEELKEASYAGKLLVMNDNCYIIIDEDNISYFGDYCYLYKGILYYENVKISLEEFLKEINYD